MPKRTHSEALQTKKNILKAAQKVFVKKGFAKTSLSDIAREANVTRGAIYWHFENKNELLAALLKEGAHDINLVSPLIAASDGKQRDPLGCLKQWVLMHLTDDAEFLFNSALCNIFESVLSSEVDSEARDKLLQIIRMRKYRIEEALRCAVRQLQLPPDIDVELAASYIHSTLLGFITSMRQGTAVRPYSRYAIIVEIMFANLPHLKRPHNSII